jgi:hypothetical protein
MQVPAPPALGGDAQAAYDDLAARFARQIERVPGWFRDRPVLYYDFGDVKRPLAVGRVLWPVHGFDKQGIPVAMRSQRPIFTSIPGVVGYSGLWTLTYVVVADNVQANEVRDTASVRKHVRARRALLRESGLTLNLPIVPRGTRLAQDSTAPLQGWYEGRDVQFFDFGAASARPAPMWRFSRGSGTSGQPILVEGQNSVVDSIPVASPYPDLWEIRFVRVDSTYRPNSLRSAAAIRQASVVVDPPGSIRNLPITIVDGGPVARTPSPIRTHANLRSPLPPSPTRP